MDNTNIKKRQKESESLTHAHPPEIVKRIFCYLPPCERLRLRSLSKELHRMLMDSVLSEIDVVIRFNYKPCSCHYQVLSDEMTMKLDQEKCKEFGYNANETYMYTPDIKIDNEARNNLYIEGEISSIKLRFCIADSKYFSCYIMYYRGAIHRFGGIHALMNGCNIEIQSGFILNPDTYRDINEEQDTKIIKPVKHWHLNSFNCNEIGRSITTINQLWALFNRMDLMKAVFQTCTCKEQRAFAEILHEMKRIDATSNDLLIYPENTIVQFNLTHEVIHNPQEIASSVLKHRNTRNKKRKLHEAINRLCHMRPLFPLKLWWLPEDPTDKWKLDAFTSRYVRQCLNDEITADDAAELIIIYQNQHNAPENLHEGCSKGSAEDYKMTDMKISTWRKYQIDNIISRFTIPFTNQHK